MKYSIDYIKTLQSVDFLFFWGHQPSKDGKITKSCFSQWWISNFIENDIIYKSAEHYMMAQKALLFNDNKAFEKIINCISPKDVKSIGREIKSFDAQIWDENKYQIVKKGNFLKFNQNQDLKNFLLSTNDKIIVEASPVDAIWGIGLAEDNPKAKNIHTWEGENLLGFALMEVRDELNT